MQHAPRPQILVAIDWDNRDRSIQPVIDFVRREGGYHAMIGATPVDHVKPNGQVVPKWRVTFDANAVRNTEVHGAGYRAGFVVGIESAKVAS